LPLDEKHLRFHGTLCFDCERVPPQFDAARSAFVFDGPIREALHRFKYQGQTALAQPLARHLADWWQQSKEVSTRLMPFESEDIEAIVPVPLHSWRRWRRGYNQSELLGREIGHIFDLPVVSALQRRRYTVSQVELSEEERSRNVQDAFAVDEKIKLPPTVLLLDDVCTTGATLNECARVLKQNSAKNIYALTLARQI
jgi:ComF family protein